MDSDAATDIYLDYDALGCWFRYGNTGHWVRSSYSNPNQVMGAARLDTMWSRFQVICNYGVLSGVWAWGELELQKFQKITNNIPEAVAGVNFSGDSDDELSADFGSQGLWFLDAIGDHRLYGWWTKISWTDPGPMMAANLEGGDEELVVDFEALGVWVYSTNNEFFQQGWTQIAYNNPDFIIRFKKDSSPIEWLIADFGLLGIWMYNYNKMTGWQWKKIATNQIPEF
jgi:hypothetical protein